MVTQMLKELIIYNQNQLEAMDGKIEIESELGHGSNFKIYLNEK
jgi:signal transduction histidine kinase